MASIIVLAIFLALSSAAAKTSEPTTTVLDVASSLKRTQSVLTSRTKLNPFSAISQNLKVDSIGNSSSFSMELVPRDILHNDRHASYKSLLRSRLARDAARVQSIYARLQLAVEGISKLDLKPLQESDALLSEKLSSPVISGSSQGSGEYFSRIGVGSPAKEFYMVLDTGSDISWLQCQPCSECYAQDDPVFEPTSSSSYSPVSCESSQCTALDVSSCRSGQCLYQVNYGDGSFTFGHFVTEALTFGKSGSANGIALGCGQDNEGLFVASAGLLGLGGGPMSLTSQLKATSFSYCLVDRDTMSSSTLDFNTLPAGESVLAPMSRSNKLPTFFYVGLTGMAVGGKLLSIPSTLFQMDASGRGGVIVDCGTAITRLRTEAYDSLRDSFLALTGDLKSAPGVALFDTCYDLSGLSTVRVPTVSFHFTDAQTWSLPASNYLIPVDSTGTYCFAFAPTTSSLSIIGNVQQQGTRVRFDLANGRVGFAASQC